MKINLLHFNNRSTKRYKLQQKYYVIFYHNNIIHKNNFKAKTLAYTSSLQCQTSFNSVALLNMFELQ